MSKKPNSPTYGPQNPHPLSTMRTELLWEGEYDEYGNRREVDVAGSSLPMQCIEVIDRPRSEAATTGQLGLFNKNSKRLSEFRRLEHRWPRYDLQQCGSRVISFPLTKWRLCDSVPPRSLGTVKSVPSLHRDAYRKDDRHDAPAAAASRGRYA